MNFLDDIPGLRWLGRDGPAHLNEAGFSLPARICALISSFEFDPPLPPVGDVLSEIATERLSARGMAWTWESRSQVVREYRSPLLDRLAQACSSGAWAGDPRLQQRSPMFIDPRLAAYLAWPFVDLPGWRSEFGALQERAASEIDGSRARFEKLCGSGVSISRRALVDFIGRCATDLRLRMTNHPASGSDRFEFRLSPADAVHEVRSDLNITWGRKKWLVDASVSIHANQARDHEHLLTVPMNLVFSPLADLYLAQRESEQDVVFNVDFCLHVFASMASVNGRSRR